jgi:hypothetical protein
MGAGSGVAWLRVRGKLPEMQHELPALQLRQKAERRHARVRIAAADLPIQLAVCLGLHVTPGQIRALRRATAIVAVTRRAALLKQLPASGDGLGSIEERIHLGARIGRRHPVAIAIGHLGENDRQRRCDGHRHAERRSCDEETGICARAHRRPRNESS